MENVTALAAASETRPPEGLSAPAPEAEANTADAERTVSLAEHRAVKREAQNLRERLRTLEAAEEMRKQSELSEVERLRQQLGEADRRARTLEVQAIRSRAAGRHGLSEDLHEFITAEDEEGALAQAEKLAARLKPVQGGLPPAGSRNPANGGDQAAALTRQEQFEVLRQGVPSLRNRTLKG